MKVRSNKKQKHHMYQMLICYDFLIYLLSAILMLVLYEGDSRLSEFGILQQMAVSAISIFIARIVGKIYDQVWRYGGIQCYIRLIVTDTIAFFIYLVGELILPVEKISFARMLSFASINLLGALVLRMLYRYTYKCSGKNTKWERFLSWMLFLFSGIEEKKEKEVQKIKVAIIGAGRVGTGLAEELMNNRQASYIPRCFIDINKEKVGREIHGIPVLTEGDATFQKLDAYEV